MIISKKELINSLL